MNQTIETARVLDIDVSPLSLIVIVPTLHKVSNMLFKVTGDPTIGNLVPVIIVTPEGNVLVDSWLIVFVNLVLDVRSFRDFIGRRLIGECWWVKELRGTT